MLLCLHFDALMSAVADLVLSALFLDDLFKLSALCLLYFLMPF
jgi:hypothetical protein